MLPFLMGSMEVSFYDTIKCSVNFNLLNFCMSILCSGMFQLQRNEVVNIPIYQ